jgi:hypothetical protein
LCASSRACSSECRSRGNPTGSSSSSSATADAAAVVAAANDKVGIMEAHCTVSKHRRRRARRSRRRLRGRVPCLSSSATTSSKHLLAAVYDQHHIKALACVLYPDGVSSWMLASNTCMHSQSALCQGMYRQHAHRSIPCSITCSVPCS